MALERRYARLLRTYPASYRVERGEEMLGTLAASSGGSQSWPTLREAASLVFGGLRKRAFGGPRSGNEIWYSGVVIAVSAVILMSPVVSINTRVKNPHAQYSMAITALAVIAALGATGLLLAGRFVAASVAFSATITMNAREDLLRNQVFPGALPLERLKSWALMLAVVAVSLLLLLLRRQAHRAERPNVTAAFPAAFLALVAIGSVPQPLPVVFAVLLLTWAAANPSVTAAMSLLAAAFYLRDAVMTRSTGELTLAIAFGGGLAAIAFFQTRRITASLTPN